MLGCGLITLVGTPCDNLPLDEDDPETKRTILGALWTLMSSAPLMAPMLFMGSGSASSSRVQLHENFITCFYVARSGMLFNSSVLAKRVAGLVDERDNITPSSGKWLSVHELPAFDTSVMPLFGQCKDRGMKERPSIPQRRCIQFNSGQAYCSTRAVISWLCSIGNKWSVKMWIPHRSPMFMWRPHELHVTQILSACMAWNFFTRAEAC